MGLSQLVNTKFQRKDLFNALKYAGGGLAVLLVFLALFSSSFFDFSGEIDKQLRDNGWPIDILKKDRIAMLKGDAFRSLIFLALAVGVLFAWAFEKVKAWHVIASLVGLVLVDQWSVCSRYLNSENFISESKYNAYFAPSNADRTILQDTTYFRVLDLSVGDPFRSAEASRFHKSIGGYHAAKLRRYQELVEAQILPNIYNLSKGFANDNIPVLNMLNMKYLISKDQTVIPNYNAMGNAWLVDEVKIVANADEEVNSLSSFDPGKTAFVNAKFSESLNGLNLQEDSTAFINLISYDPDKLVYEFESSSERFAVFSDMYYDHDKGWYAYIDDKESPYVRANYVLRGMRVPAGKHKIEFVFKPKTYILGENISLASSILLLLGVIMVCFYYTRKPTVAA